MSQDIFTDACGRRLPRIAVVELARGNMLASSEGDTTHFEDDENLLLWATDADGCFNDPQVEAYGHDYLPAEAK